MQKIEKHLKEDSAQIPQKKEDRPLRKKEKNQAPKKDEPPEQIEAEEKGEVDDFWLT